VQAQLSSSHPDFPDETSAMPESDTYVQKILRDAIGVGVNKVGISKAHIDNRIIMGFRRRNDLSGSTVKIIRRNQLLTSNLQLPPTVENADLTKMELHDFRLTSAIPVTGALKMGV